MNDFNIDDPVSRNVDMASPAVIVEPVVEMPPFTPEQIAFMETLMEETIKRLDIGVNIHEGDGYSYHSRNEYFNVEVTLKYTHPDGPFNGEQISEASDGFTVHIPSSDNGGY